MQRCIRVSLAPVAALVVALGALAAHAQSTVQGAPNAQPGRPGPAAASVEPGSAAPSRWAADLERLDEEIRLKLLTPSDPRGNWMRGVLDHGDIASQVAHFARARTAAPQEKLYLASLAGACLQRTQPVLPDCESVDRLADWARRDDDNGVPDIVLADRARQRGESDKMLAHLDEAAGKARFDEYWGRGVVAVWDWMKDGSLGYDPAAKAVAAVDYAGDQPLVWPTALQGVCANARQPAADALRASCARVGRALAERSTTWSGRLIGIAIETGATPDAAARKPVDERRSALNRVRARCDDARRARFEALESSDPARRQAALAATDAWVRAQAAVGEVAACERLVAARSR